MKHYLSYFYILLAGSLWGVIGLFNRSLSSAGFSSFSEEDIENREHMGIFSSDNTGHSLNPQEATDFIIDFCILLW